jgi:hypothetical protein
MPDNLKIAAFVFGAILVLIAFLGGNFKVFGAEIAPSVPHPVLRFVAGFLGAILLVWAMWPLPATRDVIVEKPPETVIKKSPISSPSNTPTTSFPPNTPATPPLPSVPPVVKPSPEPKASSNPKPKPSNTPNNISTGVAEIIQPLNKESVDRNVIATGTLTDLAVGDSLWIYVYPSVQKKYYPSPVNYDPDDKTWKVSLIIGSDEKEESGASFEVQLFTADAALSKDLSKWGENGTSQLPDGIHRLKSITITRK